MGKTSSKENISTIAATPETAKMNINGYFSRIRFHGYYDNPDLATLKTIHKLHIMNIPFENLSMHSGERQVLDLEAIYDKIVWRERGGWCLENNYLFAWVLVKMGYDTTLLGAKIFSTIKEEFEEDEEHMLIKVVIDGKNYITDVSFGLSLQLWEPMELVSGNDQIQAIGVFHITNQGDVWMLEKTARQARILNPEFAKSSLVNKDRRQQIYKFTLEPRQPEDFLAINDHLQIDPTSLFINKSICAVQIPTGFKALVGWTYSEVTFKPEEDVDEYDMRKITDDEIDQVLLEHFNVKLQNKLQLVNKKANFKM